MQLPESDFTLKRSYRCQVLTELPNGNNLHFFYPGGKTDGGKDGILVRISPYHGKEWIGTFAQNMTYPNSLNKILSWTETDKICVISSGIGFIVDINSPTEYKILEIEPIFYAIIIQEEEMIVFADHTNLIAYTSQGVLWETERISYDGLKITNANNLYIEGTYFDIGNNDNSTFKVDLSNGKVHGGISAF